MSVVSHQRNRSAICKIAIVLVLIFFFLSVFMNYFDNPGGNLPTWLINWAAKVSRLRMEINRRKLGLRLMFMFFYWVQSGVPGFLKDMQDACSKYANYCKNRKWSALWPAFFSFFICPLVSCPSSSFILLSLACPS